LLHLCDYYQQIGDANMGLVNVGKIKEELSHDGAPVFLVPIRWYKKLILYLHHQSDKKRQPKPEDWNPVQHMGRRYGTDFEVLPVSVLDLIRGEFKALPEHLKEGDLVVDPSTGKHTFGEKEKWTQWSIQLPNDDILKRGIVPDRLISSFQQAICKDVGLPEHHLVLPIDRQLRASQVTDSVSK
jgi:hypothetical protein